MKQQPARQSGLASAWHKFRTVQKRIWQRYHINRWIIMVVMGIVFTMSTYLTFVAKTMDVQNLNSSLKRSTVIYDVSNKKAGELYSQKGTYVGMKDISQNVPDAILSTEDRNFYNEHGFSFKGFGRAGLLWLKNKILHRDYISGGGSTITQQLVKNAYLSQEQTFSRKLKELFISIQVENVYSKNEILTMYMNNAYFGNGVYGVSDASERYFGTSVKNLPVQDAAVLAGMLTNPSGYNPVDHPRLALERRNTVLDLMVANGKITKAQAAKYKAQPIEVRDNYSYKDSYRYPYYFDAVIDEAINRYGLSEADIMNRGYKIYTNLDQSQQQTMQSNFNDPNMFPQNAADGTKVQAASISVNPQTGGVNAVVGGRGKHVFRGYNRATQMKRQPGSTMKPLAVYTPAIESGYNFDSELVNEKKSYGKNKYTPQNYNDQYTGKVPMYEALAQSMNAPAVWLLNKIGVQSGYSSVKKFGIPITNSDKNLSLALGGLSTGVSPQQMAGAYTAFANNGVANKPYYIRKIVDASGNVIIDNTDQQKGTRVMSAATAKTMTSMMLGVFDNGTGVDAKPYGYQVAGKTGSTEADSTTDADATRDKWIIGYTPNVVVATWEGFDDTNSNHHLENLSGTGIGPLFKSEMTSIIPTTKQTQFDTKDAQSIIDERNSANNSGSSSSSNLWNNVKDSGNSIGKNIENGFDAVKKQTSKWFNDAKSFLGGN
ncbi:transglycosylase domain-containing protein [Lactobacillus sp. Sy-1]|uniref:transglycosylase domain-containing protein n=1 Tax=Lactobacillus sp. Sy-1 TaxID=2109645 RepID=UPI001C56775B|nr:PBP1A family penicillin-binding protein [Lactobacillus sp. Sy-1]MBW1605717.1 PBP1A family penicillin-binding protein [Lactobacillus sp. Sy-1]